DRPQSSSARHSFGGDDKFLPMNAFRGSASLTQSWNHFHFGVAEGVATVTFDRPQKLNALTFQVYADLRDLLTELPQRDGVRVLQFGQQVAKIRVHLERQDAKIGGEGDDRPSPGRDAVDGSDDR